MTDEASSKSVIAKGATFTGRVKSETPVTVSGTLEGDLDAPELEVTEGGVVSGRVKVETLRSKGELSGQIEAGLLELEGKVRDDTTIRARKIEVTLSSEGDAPLSLTFGNCKVSVGDVPKTDGGGGGGGGGGKGNRKK